MKKNFFTMFLILALNVLVAAQKSDFNFDSQIGVMDVNAKKELCLVIANANLSEGSKVTLIAPNKPQVIGEAVVVGKKLTESCTRDSAISEDKSFYLLKLSKNNPRFFNGENPLPPSIAVFNSKISFQLIKGIASVDLNGDGKKEYFRQCTSNEGIHLTVWTGSPLSGKRNWHWYYYLGYDVPPNCNAKDYQEQ